METIIEKNKMLAEFMGFEDRVRFVGGANQLQKHIRGNRFEMYHYNQLKYHEDWYWLMPVLEKLCRTRIGDGEVMVDFPRPYTFGMLSEEGKMLVRLNGFPVHAADTLIEATYEAICEAVEYISKNKEA